MKVVIALLADKVRETRTDIRNDSRMDEIFSAMDADNRRSYLLALDHLREAEALLRMVAGDCES